MRYSHQSKAPPTLRGFWLQITLLIASIAVIGLPLLSYQKGAEADSFFGLLLQGAAESKVEATISEQLRLLYKIESFHSWVRYRVFGLSPKRQLVLGTDDWFFRAGGMLREADRELPMPRVIEEHIGLNSFSQEDLRRWARVLRRREKYLEKRGIRYLVTMAPRKTSIYPEALPAGIQQRAGISRGQQLLSYLQTETDLAVVNLRQHLKTIRRQNPEGPLLYFKTDGHWNRYGALLAYRALAKKVDKLFPQRTIVPLAEADFKLRFDHDWYHRGFARVAGIRIYEPYPYLLPKTGNPLRSVVILGERGAWRQPPQETWRDYQAENVLFHQGIGRTGIPEVELQSDLGAIRTYKRLENFGTPPLETVLVVGDSMIERTLHYLSAHSNQLYFYRKLSGFPLHLFQVDPQAVGPIELVIQQISLGALETPPKNPPPLRY